MTDRQLDAPYDEVLRVVLNALEIPHYAYGDNEAARSMRDALELAAAALRSETRAPYYNATGPIHVVCQCDKCMASTPKDTDVEMGAWVRRRITFQQGEPGEPGLHKLEIHFLTDTLPEMIDTILADARRLPERK